MPDPSIALRASGSPWPRISIVTPSYNQSAFIEETIRAVLLQGYPNLEYIISEDCSTDDSMAVIRKYEQWVKVIVGDRNRGMSYAINKGYEICTGDIITWIATDDVYLPGAFAVVTSHWPSIQDSGAVVGSFHFMDANSVISSVINLPHLPYPGPIDLTLTTRNWRLHQVSTFYLRDALDNVGRYVREDLRHNMDRELIYRIAMKYKIFLIDEALAAFRIHGHSKSWSYANMISMAREYASIQYMFLSGDPQEDAIRKQIARQRIAKGYVKYAKYNPHLFASIGALFQAVYYWPGIGFSKGYIRGWLEALRILPMLRKLRKTTYHP